MGNVILASCYVAMLLMQLKDPKSTFLIEDSMGSWIASMADFATIPGNIFIAIVIGKLGRKKAHICINAINLLCWLMFAFATDVKSILIARLLQGFAIAMTIPTVPTLISEYSSPKHRGVFITTTLASTPVMSFCVLTAGLYIHWHTVALLCACYTLVTLIIVLRLPESPSWLIEKTRYEDARRVFFWLRDKTEEQELKNMIEAHVRLLNSRTTSKSVKGQSNSFISSTLTMLKKREFCYPVIAVWHLYALFQWSGYNCFTFYMGDTYKTIMAGDEYMALIITTVSIQVFFSNFISIYITKLFSRKVLLATTIGVHVAVMLSIAGYVHFRYLKLLPFDHPAIGITLIHLQSFTLNVGPAHMLFVIGGEIFPMEFRSLAHSVTSILSNPSNALSVKTAPYLMNTLGLPATYCLYATIVVYCVIVCYMVVPETRDKTLYDIEQEIKGDTVSNELKLITKDEGDCD